MKVIIIMILTHLPCLTDTDHDKKQTDFCAKTDKQISRIYSLYFTPTNKVIANIFLLGDFFFIWTYSIFVIFTDIYLIIFLSIQCVIHII